MIRYLFRFVLVVAMAVLVAGCSAEGKKAKTLERAGGYYRAGDFERAVIEYQNVLQKFPDDPTANGQLALIWTERGATMRALAYLNKIIQLAPENLEYRLKRAQLYLTLGRVADARNESVLILAGSTSVPDALVLLTETVRDAEDYKAANQILEKFNEKNTVSFHIASANLLMRSGDTAKAKAAVQRAIDVDPKSPAAHSAMAGFYASQGNAVQAAAEHKTAAELAPVRSTVRTKHAGYLAQTGAVPEALAALTEMTRQAPDYLPAWRSLAQIALLEKRYDDALALIAKILSRDTAEYEARILRAQVLLAKGDATQAIEELQRLGESYKGFGLEKYPLALAHLKNNDQANAMAALEQTVAQFPDNIEAVLLLAQLNLRAGKPEPVAAAMAALINRRPDLLPPYLLLIEASKALGKLDELAGIVAANLAKTPNNPQLHYVLGIVRIQQGKDVAARQSFEKSLELSPNTASTIIELVKLEIKAGKLAMALQWAQSLVEKMPKLAEGHFLVAKVHATQKQWTEVEAAAMRAIEIDANHAGAYELLIDSFEARRDQPEMIGKLEAFLAKHPNDVRAVLVCGEVFQRAKKFTEARDLYEKFLSANPSSSLVLNNLAILYADHLQQPERALEMARKAWKLDPGIPQISDTLGWILYQQKAFSEALPYLEESAKKLPKDPEVQYHLGMVNRALNRPEAALAALRIAVSAPENFTGKEEAKRQLAQLEAGK